MTTSSNLVIPERFNYIAVFLTLACNLKCSFCINRYGNPGGSRAAMSPERWIEGLNRIVCRPDVPLTLQGGEPSLYRGFYPLINGLRRDLNIDILTNLQLDVDAFMDAVRPERLRREAPYASIRVSYHPEQMDLRALMAKVLRLMENGYSVGIWAVRHPAHLATVEQAREECAAVGIDFRFKEFLGWHDGRLHGEYRYDEALSRTPHLPVECRTTELIIGPGGDVFRCHADLYEGRPPVGHLNDEAFQIEDRFRPCERFGFCNPCDVKLKTDRFQRFGHTSVTIRGPELPVNRAGAVAHEQA